MRLTLTLSTVLLLSAAACSSPSDDSSKPPSSFDDSGTAPEATWHGDVEPLLQSRCVRCHSPDGAAPGDFTDVEVVELLAQPILAAIESGTMPPPVSDPDCRTYVGSSMMRLTEAEKAQVRAWVEADLPRGTPGGGPTEALPARLASPDAIITMPEPYIPTFERPDEPGNEYRCFILDPSDYAGQYITALGPEVGEPALFHHIVLSTVDKDDVEARHLDPQGWECMDGTPDIDTDEMIAGFAPGTPPQTYPEGSGIQIPEDSYLLLDMHYYANPDAVGKADQSGIAIQLADSVERPLFLWTFGTFDFEIPAGEAAVRAEESDRMPFDLEILTMGPHMHGLGDAYGMKVAHADGSESCVVEGDYDFDNQIFFLFDDPIRVNAGDKVDYHCQWDNSAGTRDVYYGERTDEEMCFFFGLVAEAE